MHTKHRRNDEALSWIRLGRTRIALNIVAVAWGLFLIGTHQTGDAQNQSQNKKDGPWEILEGCQLSPNVSNDGDSFHVRTKDGQEHVFRLYMVDAPETSHEFPDRVAEQAQTFDTSPAKAVAAGLVAAVVTEKLLSPGNFTVKTKGEDAMGRSTGGRTYAIVQLSNGEDLGSVLLKLGLARSYGKDIPSPTGKERKLGIPEATDYDRFAARAKTLKIGVWGKGDLDLAADSLISNEEAAALEEKSKAASVSSPQTGKEAPPKIKIRPGKVGIKAPTSAGAGAASETGTTPTTPAQTTTLATIPAPSPATTITAAPITAPASSPQAAKLIQGTTNVPTAQTISTPYGTMSVSSRK
jgi:endonuclease YncB( thermonuclease family)